MSSKESVSVCSCKVRGRRPLKGYFERGVHAARQGMNLEQMWKLEMGMHVHEEDPLQGQGGTMAAGAGQVQSATPTCMKASAFAH